VDDRNSTRPRRTDQPGTDAGPHTILLVEDDPCVRKVLTRMLTAAGFRVITASGGDEALERCSTEPGRLTCF